MPTAAPLRLLLACLPALTASAAPSLAPEMRAFLADHCVRCHGPDKQKGDIRLDDLRGDMTREGPRWAVILDQIRSGAMPPEDEPPPAAAAVRAAAAWIGHGLGAGATRRPAEGNLVPHELLFGPAAPAAAPPPPRVWRLGPESYDGFLRDLGRSRVPGVVPPFSPPPERGFKDYAALGGMDEPTAGILLRNAEALVESQCRHEIVDGRVRHANDTVRDFTDLMDPARAPTRAELEKAIRTQYRLALARDPDAGEIESLLGLHRACAAGGDGPGAVRTMLTAVLLRAEAVFRPELGGPGGRLTPREIANALGATLLSRREKSLLEAAEKGRLDTRDGVAAEVRRLLADPRVQKPRLPGFFREYLEYGHAPDVFKDRAPDLMHEPRQHVADTDLLVAHILASDRDVLGQVLTTPLAFVNVAMREDKADRTRRVPARVVTPNAHNNRGQAVMETLYGLSDWTPDQPVRQRPGTRAGLLMQPSWLVAWSGNFDNDAVRRGRFIRERLLGGTVPDLPIGVAAQVPDDPARTLRDRLGLTRDPDCWKCHRRMDELGLPFELFDHYARLREAEMVLDPAATAANVDRKGKPLGPVLRPAPLDTRGYIRDSGDPAIDGPVSGPHELMARLASSDRVRQVFIRHVFRYFLGRNESLADAATLRAADRAYVESGGSFHALLTSLLTSDSFLLRRTTSTPGT